MNLNKEFVSALRDGLGSKDAKAFEVHLLDELKGVGVAFSWEKRVMYYLLLGHENQKPISASRYLALARMLSARYACFVAPAKKVGSFTGWGTKCGIPVHSYKFKVLNVPKDVLI